MHLGDYGDLPDEYRFLDRPEKLEQILTSINRESFRSWYHERERTRNIREGTPYFNSPRPSPPPERQSPSRLLQCHRRVYYQLNNAPAETPSPKGVYWFGSRFETDIVLPFLRSLVGPELYVRNSMWVDFKIESSDNELHFKGETDPVIVDGDSEPQLLTEIKTTSSISKLEEVRPKHKAQAHVYLNGLSQQYETSVNDAVIIYGDRETFDLCSFHISFDSEFWHGSVLKWAEENSQYRQNQELPPAKPEAEWECSICPFQHRCGKSDDQYDDLKPFGLLPRFEDYPKERVETYLQAHTGAKLTPTLAYRYPELTDEYESYDWRCPVCSSEYPWQDVTWVGDVEKPPLCPTCRKTEIPAQLSGPSVEEQQALAESEIQ